MEYEKIKTVEEITDLKEFNAYLAAGWVCIDYCKVSVSPDCHAAESAFASSSVNARLPCARIPIRWHSISGASALWA